MTGLVGYFVKAATREGLQVAKRPEHAERGVMSSFGGIKLVSVGDASRNEDHRCLFDAVHLGGDGGAELLGLLWKHGLTDLANPCIGQFTSLFSSFVAVSANANPRIRSKSDPQGWRWPEILYGYADSSSDHGIRKYLEYHLGLTVPAQPRTLASFYALPCEPVGFRHLLPLLLGVTRIISGSAESQSGEHRQCYLYPKRLPVAFIVLLGFVCIFLDGYGLYHADRWWGLCLFLIGWLGIACSVYLLLDGIGETAQLGNEFVANRYESLSDDVHVNKASVTGLLIRRVPLSASPQNVSRFCFWHSAGPCVGFRQVKANLGVMWLSKGGIFEPCKEKYSLVSGVVVNGQFRQTIEEFLGGGQGINVDDVALAARSKVAPLLDNFHGHWAVRKVLPSLGIRSASGIECHGMACVFEIATRGNILSHTDPFDCACGLNYSPQIFLSESVGLLRDSSESGGGSALLQRCSGNVFRPVGLILGLNGEVMSISGLFSQLRELLLIEADKSIGLCARALNLFELPFHDAKLAVVNIQSAEANQSQSNLAPQCGVVNPVNIFRKACGICWLLIGVIVAALSHYSLLYRGWDWLGWRRLIGVPGWGLAACLIWHGASVLLGM